MDKPSKEYQEFTSLVDRLLTVPKDKIHEKMAEHRARSAKNPNKPGPKAGRKRAKKAAR